VPWDVRQRIAPHWTLHGMVYLRDSSRTDGDSAVPDADVQSTARVAALIQGSAPRNAPEGRDPAARYIDHLLRCPAKVLEHRAGASRDTTGSLDSICNFR
jgi:hypothetical protein